LLFKWRATNQAVANFLTCKRVDEFIGVLLLWGYTFKEETFQSYVSWFFFYFYLPTPGLHLLRSTCIPLYNDIKAFLFWRSVPGIYRPHCLTQMRSLSAEVLSKTVGLECPDENWNKISLEYGKYSQGLGVHMKQVIYTMMDCQGDPDHMDSWS
jgi:hypothetical protein